MITPKHIDTEKHFGNVFGSYEASVQAWWIVCYCQMKGQWVQFREAEIKKYWSEFAVSLESKYVSNNDGVFEVTPLFIALANSIAPAKLEEKEDLELELQEALRIFIKSVARFQKTFGIPPILDRQIKLQIEQLAILVTNLIHHIKSNGKGAA